MKKGDVLNGYTIETTPTNAGGGMSQWAFGSKDGTQVFIKMFLAPKYPLDDGPGSAASKDRKRAICIAFEKRHLEIAERLDPTKPGGGNLVVATDFFRVDSTYVKVMPRINAAALPDAATMTGFQIQVLLRSLAFSLRMLHAEDVVHGDIKPDNVMVEQPNESMYVSKLIDFDEAYVVGDPPEPQHIVGDPIFYSPELLRYIKEDDRLPADALGTPSDIFSLGLVLHHFLSGRLPDFDRSMVNYPAEALLSGNSLDIAAAPDAVQPFLARMLSVVPDRRPTIQGVIDFLADIDADDLVRTGPAPTTPVLVSVAIEQEKMAADAEAIAAYGPMPVGPMPGAGPASPGRAAGATSPAAALRKPLATPPGPKPSTSAPTTMPAGPMPTARPDPTPTPTPRPVPSSRTDATGPTPPTPPTPGATPRPKTGTTSPTDAGTEARPGLRSTMGRRPRPTDDSAS